MKKRKIFYFLKTKEEYDYMLSGGLIPRRGIVLIESTQEIYRDKKPYSGYGPLKTYFDSLRTELQSLIRDKDDAILASANDLDQRVKQDLESYNSQFQTKLDSQLEKINVAKQDLSTLNYYVNNTVVPSLEQVKNNTENLSTKYSELLQQISGNTALVNQFKTQLNGLTTNIQDFKSQYNTKLQELNNSVLQASSTTDGITETQARNLFKSLQMTDSDFTSKVQTIVNPLLNNLKTQISESVNAKVRELQSSINSLSSSLSNNLSNNNNSGGGGNSSNTGTTTTVINTDYADQLFNTHATTTQYGTVILGQYLKLDSGGKLTIDVTNLKTALSSGTGTNTTGLSNATQDLIESMKADIRTLKSVINDNTIDSKVQQAVGNISIQSIASNINWTELYGTGGFKLAVKNVLSQLSLISNDQTNHGTTQTVVVGGKKLYFENGFFISASDVPTGGNGTPSSGHGDPSGDPIIIDDGDGTIPNLNT